MKIATSSPTIPQRAKAPMVRLTATLGIVFVASFETWHALRSTITWHDWPHFVAAIGSIYFLSNAIKNGFWGLTGSNAPE